MPPATRHPERATARRAERPSVREPHERFDIDRRSFPPGMDVAWKATTIFGMPNPRLRDAFVGGWEPCRAADWPEFSGLDLNIPESVIKAGYVKLPGPDDPVVLDGQMLMQRAEALTERAEEQRDQAAKEVVDTQLRRLFGQSRREVGRERTIWRQRAQPIAGDGESDLNVEE